MRRSKKIGVMAKRTLPPMSKLTELEARAVESMFRVYDYQAKGRISQHAAYKLTAALGFKFSIHSLPVNGTLKDLLLFLDVRVPDPEPALYCQLHSFTNLVAKPVSELAPMSDRVNEGLEGDVAGEGSMATTEASVQPGQQGGSIAESVADSGSVGSQQTGGSQAMKKMYRGDTELISTRCSQACSTTTTAARTPLANQLSHPSTLREILPHSQKRATRSRALSEIQLAIPALEEAHNVRTIYTCQHFVYHVSMHKSQRYHMNSLLIVIFLLHSSSVDDLSGPQWAGSCSGVMSHIVNLVDEISVAHFRRKKSP